jgi:hypothetical protein
MRKLSTPMPLKPHEGTSKHIVTYGGVQAYRLTDGVDMQQGQQISQSVSSYTPSEVGVQLLMAKSTLRRSPDPELQRRAGRIMSAAYDKFEDKDGCNIMDSFTTSRGGAGTIMSPGLVVSAVTGLAVSNDVADPEEVPGPIYGVFHPCSLAALAGRLRGLSSGYDITAAAAPGSLYSPNTVGGAVAKNADQGIGAELLKRGPKALTSIMGVPIYVDANIAVDASSDAKNAIFSKEALVYVSEMEPTPDPDDDPSARAIEMNLVGSYIYGGYNLSKYGCEVYCDASIPTS